MKSQRQKGQVALIVVLLMVVAGTIALSVVSRSTVDVGISKQEENKIRAFSVAEAGIEDLLSKTLSPGSETDVPVDGTLTYSYDVNALGSSGYALAQPLQNGEMVEIKLNGQIHSTFAVLWGDVGTQPASLEISAYKTGNAVERFAFNPYGITRNNGFSQADDGTSFGYHSRKEFSTGVSTWNLVRIKALYGSTSLEVDGSGGTFPAQAYEVKVSSTVGESAAAVEVVQETPALPGIFDYVLWSRSGTIGN